MHTFYLHTERISCSNAIVHKTLNFVPLKLLYLKEKNLLIIMRRCTMSLVMYTKNNDNLNFCQILCSLSQGMSFNIDSNTFWENTSTSSVKWGKIKENTNTRKCTADYKNENSPRVYFFFSPNISQYGDAPLHSWQHLFTVLWGPHTKLQSREVLFSSQLW